MTCSQFDWTKKEFQGNKITLEKSVFTIILFNEDHMTSVRVLAGLVFSHYFILDMKPEPQVKIIQNVL